MKDTLNDLVFGVGFTEHDADERLVFPDTYVRNKWLTSALLGQLGSLQLYIKTSL